MDTKLEVATLGGGCFWCTEAVFQQVKGVETVISGFSGGTVPGHPTYREVCSGLTGHAEVVQVSFDANVISYEDILVIFMTTHDPTSLNQQGADRGTHYRSVIFYHDDSQKEIAENVIINLKPYYEHPIVTELTAFKAFYEADQSHQDFYRNNPNQGYCNYVITPKLMTLRKLHADKLK
ncbi:peptide-methionine (S)-S-oxide reductase MsrA [Psychroserpens sp. XS_ASV72]|uniref:peptide-methionine (S)-S-oxide reductase MsrA n=1 Tax=Psychroserpens sp. XS_ASV72 TaxID=3241293 RepID=UPI00351124B5